MSDYLDATLPTLDEMIDSGWQHGFSLSANGIVLVSSSHPDPFIPHTLPWTSGMPEARGDDD